MQRAHIYSLQRSCSKVMFSQASATPFTGGGVADTPWADTPHRQTAPGQTPPARVPTRTGKPGKMGRNFPVRENLGNSEQTGKVRENHTKYWKTQGI